MKRRKTVSFMGEKRELLPLIFSLGISVFGNEMQSIAFAWWTLTYTGSSAQAAMVFLFHNLPRLLFGPIAGTVADRFNRKYLLIVAEAIGAVLIFIVAILAHFNALSPLIVFMVNFLLGLVTVIIVPTQQTILPSLLDNKNLAQGNALLQMMRSMAGITGPALGGVLMSFIGIEGMTWVNLLTFLLSVLWLSTLPTAKGVPTKPRTKQKFREDIMVGFSYLKRDSKLMRLFVVAMLVNVLLMAYTALLPALVKNYLELDAQAFGVLTTSFFIGAMISNLLLTKIEQLSSIQFFSYGLIAAGLSLYGLGLSTTLPQGFVSVLFFGGAITLVSISIVTFLQQYTPDHLRGRILSLRYSSSSGARPLGLAFSAILAILIGEKLTIIATGGAFVILGISTVWFMQNLLNSRPENLAGKTRL